MRIFRRMFRTVLARAGYGIYNMRGLPFGVDLLNDLRRLHLTEGLVEIFDVGANNGTWTRQMRHEFPKARFRCFEPAPETYCELIRNLQGLDDIWTFPLALGSRRSMQELFVYERSEINSLIRPSMDRQDFITTIEVKLMTLDDICRELNVVTVDLLKIDTEGYDLEVLRGADTLLRAGHIRAILAECEFEKMVVGDPHSDFFELCSFLRERGYVFVTLYTEAVHPERGFIFGSALFMRVRGETEAGPTDSATSGATPCGSAVHQ